MQDIAKYPVMKHVYGNLIRSRKLSYVPKINARHMSNVPKMCRILIALSSYLHSFFRLYPTAFSLTFTYINRMLSIHSHFHYDISVDILNNVP